MTELSEGHIVKGYDVDLTGLRMRLLEMGGLVLSQVQHAVRALLEGDCVLARAVLAREEEVNGYDIRIDEDSTLLIARRQPMGGDLRAIIAIVRTVSDLERIGDEAKKIARFASGAGRETDVRASTLSRDARTMSRLATGMLREALDAFDRTEVATAVGLSHRDMELNAEFQSALRRLVTVVMEDPRRLQSAIAAIFVLKSLERIGDHAKNIGRHVVYLVQGRDVRHEDTAVLLALDETDKEDKPDVGGRPARDQQPRAES
jgi:phosphate transport system protein